MGYQNFSRYNRYAKTRHNYGGVLRNLQSGRGSRPLSSRDPHHLVYKVDRSVLREKSLRGYRSFALVTKVIHKYSFRFSVKLEQMSIQGDHIHILVRCRSRRKLQSFFRVTTGQIAQLFGKEGLLKKVTDTTGSKILKKGTRLWRYRPFSRVVRGWRGYQIVRNYIQLNEKEALGEIKYNKLRLRGLKPEQWAILWA